MVENLKEAGIFKNKTNAKTLTLEVSESLFRISFNFSGENHTLIAYDLLCDSVFVSEVEPTSLLNSLIQSKEGITSDEGVLTKFAELKGAIHYKLNRNIGISLRLQTHFASIVYSLNVDDKLSNNFNKRDKYTLGNIDFDVEEKVESDQFVDNENTFEKLNYEDSAKAAIKKNEYKKALEFTIKGLEGIESDKDKIHLLLIQADIYNKTRRAADSLEVCEKILKLDPDNALAYAEKAFSVRENAKYDLALECIDKALKIDSSNPKFYYIKGFILNCKASSHNDEALKYVNQGITLDPNYSVLFALKGMIYGEQQKDQEAIVLFDKAALLDPYESSSYSWKGYYYKSKKNFIKAKECYLKAIEVDPENFIAYDILGDIYLTVDYDYENAKKYFEIGHSINPKSRLNLVHIGQTYLNMKQYEKALEWVNMSINLDDKFDLAYEIQSKTYTYMGGKDNEAIEALKKAASVGGKKRLHYEVAQKLYYNKRFQEAYDYAMDYCDEDYPGVMDLYSQLQRYV